MHRKSCAKRESLAICATFHRSPLESDFLQFQLGEEFGEGLGRVAQIQVDAFLPGVNRILYSGVAGLEVEVEDEDIAAVVHCQNGHSIDGSAYGS